MDRTQHERVPVIVIADDGYVGQDEVALAAGPGFDVAVVEGDVAALTAVAARDTPLVVLPQNLEPTPGAALLARLAAQPPPFVGLLLVDANEIATLRDSELDGVHVIATRPLRDGALRLHLRAAAATRAALRAARDEAGGRRRGGLPESELMHALRHELRGHTQGIIGLSELLRELEGPNLSEEGREWCERITVGGERLVHLVDDLVVYVDLGRRPLEPARLDALGVAGEVIGALRESRGARAADVATEGPGYRVHADRRDLELALRHLIANSLRFSLKPTPRVRVSVAPTEVGGRGGFAVTVSDDGLGLTASAQARVAGLFERSHTHVEGLEVGGGVGLAIVDCVVRRHGGALTIASEPDRGAAFSLFFPDP
ncbi:MAG: HAMP domain-containing histidine kinase [Deltaproteobacteria bacterium]|nr:HAMP domain-containing histidine kinase [Deltaproteobacteria bacterium]